MMPSQPNGQAFSQVRSVEAGIERRLTPWKPSQPAIWSASMRWVRPSFS